MILLKSAKGDLIGQGYSLTYGLYDEAGEQFYKKNGFVQCETNVAFAKVL